jgi:Flp pilus assembly protein TadG
MFWRKWKIRGLRGDSGSAAVETALSAAMFLTFMYGVINFGYLYYTKVTLQNAVRQGARYAITGNCTSGSCYSGAAGDRLSTIVTVVQNYSFNLNPTITVSCVAGECPSSAGNGGTTGNAGGPGDTVQVSARYTFAPVFLKNVFPSGGYTYTVSAVFKNELFPPPPSS